MATQYFTTPICRANFRFDLCFAIFALCFALLIHYTAVSRESGGTRYIDSDAQQIVAFAAALDHPEAFTRDPLLSDPQTFGWYKSIHVPLIRWLAGGKDYGLAYEKLTGVHQFLHLVGFYLLGLCFIRQRWLAGLFAICVSLEFWFGWGTFWGSLRAAVPLPRVTYTALFSFLCAAMCLVRRRCRFWPYIFLGMGLLVYVHAISALGMGFAMWLGLWHFKPETLSRARHVRHMFIAGLCFVLPSLPFVAHFLGYFGNGAAGVALSAEDMLFLRSVAEYRIPETFTRLGPQLFDFLFQLATQPPLLPLALCGVWAVRRYGTPKEQELLPMLALWTLGIALTVGVFAVEHEIARHLGRLPLQYDMVRCVRFVAFFCFVAFFLGFSVFLDTCILQTRFFWGRWIPAMIAIGCLLLFLLQGAIRPVLYRVFPFDAGYAAAAAKEKADGELVRALRERTPPGARIFLESGDYLVRYAALRNLSFSHKDGVILLYGKNIQKLEVWYPMARRLENPQNIGLIANDLQKADARTASAPEEVVACARETDSEYLVVFSPANLSLLQQAGEIVWNNSHYVMLRLAPRQ